jgi:hypothetical protein
MNYPFDIKKIISSYISLHDRLGYAQFDKILVKQLLQPRNRKGCALKMSSYYNMPKKIGSFRQFGFNKNSYFLRRSKLDFMYIVKHTSFESTNYCHIDMFPQFENKEKLQSIMLHPDLTLFILQKKQTFWITQSKTQVTITWCQKIPLGYNLHSEIAYENYPAKMRQEAWEIVCNLIEKSIQLKKIKLQ